MVRKDRTGEEAIWDLFRFYPMIEVWLNCKASDICLVDTRNLILEKSIQIGFIILTLFFSQELIEKLNKGELPKDEYHCMNYPTDPFITMSQRTNGRAQVASIREGQSTAPHSMRSRRTATWARSRFSDDGSSK